MAYYAEFIEITITQMNLVRIDLLVYTSIIGKISEHILSEEIFSYLTINSKITSTRRGFLSNG